MWTRATWKQRLELLSRLELDLYPLQWEVVKDNHRLRIAAGGERAGKSFIASVDMVSRLPWGNEYWLVGPDYYLPRAEFEYVEQWLWQLGAISSTRAIKKPKEGSWSLTTKSHQLVITRTSADVRKLAARSVDGILMCEAGQQSYATYLKCLGRLSESRGFLLCSGTFESSYDWYATTHVDWTENPSAAEGTAYSLPTWANVAIFPGGREDEEIKRLERLYAPIPGYFMEKCGATPAPPLGVVFREFSYRLHVQDAVGFLPNVPVYLGVDPGHGGASAYAVVACQFIHNPYWDDMDEEPEDRIDICNIIDAIYVPGGDFDTIMPIVKNALWYEATIGGAIDVEAPDERKRWRKYLGIPLQSKKVRVAEGERRLHSFLHEGPGGPHIQISAEVSKRAIEEFRKYRSPVDTPLQLESRPSSAARHRRGPEHLLKALWYLLYLRYGPVKGRDMPSPWTREAWRGVRNAFRLRY